jgi:hypothetical protein
MKGDWAGSGGLWILYDGDGREWAWWVIRACWCVVLVSPFAWTPWPTEGPRLFLQLRGPGPLFLSLVALVLVWRLVRASAEAFLRAIQTQGWRRTKQGHAYWFVGAFFLPFLLLFQFLGGHFRWGSWGDFEAFQVCLLLAFMLLLELFVGLRRMSEAREEAEDKAQRSRLEPHFLFNVLNDIQAQIPSDPAAAQGALAKVSYLMRAVLALVEKPMVTLEEELAFVESYLGLQKLRLGTRLRVVVAVSDEAEALLVPTLAVHTLVENALKHGIARNPKGGEVRIWARVEPRYDAFRTSCDLQVGVENDLPEGVPPGQAEGTGTGLASLRARLQDPGDLQTEVEGTRFRATLTWRQP